MALLRHPRRSVASAPWLARHGRRLATMSYPPLSAAQTKLGSGRCVLDLLKEIIDVGNTLVWSTPSALPWMIAVLLLAGLFVTIRLSFIQLRQCGHALRAVLGMYDDPDALSPIGAGN